MDVIPISQSTELLLSSSVPAVKPQLAAVGCEIQRMHLHTDGSCNKKPISRLQVLVQNAGATARTARWSGETDLTDSNNSQPFAESIC